MDFSNIQRNKWNQQNGHFYLKKSIIDYIIPSHRRIFTIVKVIQGVNLDSDQRILVADLKTGKVEPQKR